MPYRDLREYLAALEKKGLLCHVGAIGRIQNCLRIGGSHAQD